MMAPGLIKVLNQSADPGICPDLLRLAELAATTKDPTEKYRRWRKGHLEGPPQPNQEGQKEE